LRNETVYLIKGIKRWQGFYVKKNFPDKIKTLKDLVDKDLILANRQRGSGTRALLDYSLNRDGYSGEDIAGYQKEYTTHTNVALAVLSGNADVGLGIQSVANMMDLDFIPLALEDYDFMIPERYLNDTRVKRFVELLESDTFKNTLENLGGYEFEGIKWQVIQNDR
jgi:putative molybdopterin biosynthesis protein